MDCLYPAFLNLSGREALVVGGGRIALRKTLALLAAGARVTVIAPDVCAALASRQGIVVRRRRYRAADMARKWLVIAATGDAAVNRRVFEDAASARVFCNVVDSPSLCSMQAPAAVRRGLLQIAVSTGGACPALAARIRRQIDKTYGPEYARLLAALGDLRNHFHRKHPGDPERRQRLMKSFVNSAAPALLLAKADVGAFMREVRRWKSR